MICCSCNVLTENVFLRAIKREEARIAKAPSLMAASALVFRSACEDAGEKPRGCGSCVKQLLPGMLKEAGYFRDENPSPCVPG